MIFRQIRSATITLTLGGERFLIDPWLREKGTMGPLRDKVTERLGTAEAMMPMTSLPLSVEEVLEGVTAYVVTHVHPDHFDLSPDGTGGHLLHKNLPIFVQNFSDESFMIRSGFQDVRWMSSEINRLRNVEFLKTPGRHGEKEPMGEASGVLFRAKGEKTVYVAGDTIWYPEVEKVIQTHHPQVIILNACAASLEKYGRLIMDGQDVLAVCHAAPYADVIVSHMDAVSHATLSRNDIRRILDQDELGRRVRIPEDGEVLEF